MLMSTEPASRKRSCSTFQFGMDAVSGQLNNTDLGALDEKFKVSRLHKYVMFCFLVAPFILRDKGKAGGNKIYQPLVDKGAPKELLVWNGNCCLSLGDILVHSVLAVLLRL